MSKLKSFIMTSVLGGLIVVSPAAILLAVFAWLFGVIKSFIQPLTSLVAQFVHLQRDSGADDLLAVLATLGIITASCFFIGIAVKTRAGRLTWDTAERRILHLAPGYRFIKETVLQLLGTRESPFSSVALVQLFGNDTLCTAFVTDRHENGWYTVFVPTGPNPTTGGIFHLKPEFVHHVNLPVESIMRSVIGCGSGSGKILKAVQEQRSTECNGLFLGGESKAGAVAN